MTFNFEMFRRYKRYMYVFTPQYSTTAWYHTYCSKNINCTLYMLPCIDGATCHYVKALSSSGQLLVIYQFLILKNAEIFLVTFNLVGNKTPCFLMVCTQLCKKRKLTSESVHFITKITHFSSNKLFVFNFYNEKLLCCRCYLHNSLLIP